MGLLIKGITDLGILIVSGLILVPYPPTRIKAFIMFADIKQIYKVRKGFII